MPEVLCTADDAGLTEGVTRAILDCLDNGSLQGTSVMAGGCHAHEAMRQLRERPGALAAVHLNLFEGKACASPAAIPDLAGEAGFFRHNLGSLWRALSLSGPGRKERLREQIFTEFRAQIDAVRHGTGRDAVRLDGHLHIHAMPGLLPVMKAVFQAYPVAYVRVPLEGRYYPALPPRLLGTGLIRRELLAAWSSPLRSLAAKHGVRTPDAFLGAYASGAMTMETLRLGLAALARKKGPEPGLVEIMVHPGALSGERRAEERAWYAGSAYADAHEAPARQEELAMLRSEEFAAALAGAGFTPLSDRP